MADAFAVAELSCLASSKCLILQLHKCLERDVITLLFCCSQAGGSPGSQIAMVDSLGSLLVKQQVVARLIASLVRLGVTSMHGAPTLVANWGLQAPWDHFFVGFVSCFSISDVEVHTRCVFVICLIMWTEFD